MYQSDLGCKALGLLGLILTREQLPPSRQAKLSVVSKSFEDILASPTYVSSARSYLTDLPLLDGLRFLRLECRTLNLTTRNSRP